MKTEISGSNPSDPWMSGRQAAGYLGVSLGTLYNWTAGKRIPHRKRGNALVFRRSELDAWMEAQATPVPVAVEA